MAIGAPAARTNLPARLPEGDASDKINERTQTQTQTATDEQFGPMSAAAGHLELLLLPDEFDEGSEAIPVIGKATAKQGPRAKRAESGTPKRSPEKSPERLALRPVQAPAPARRPSYASIARGNLPPLIPPTQPARPGGFSSDKVNERTQTTTEEQAVISPTGTKENMEPGEGRSRAVFLARATAAAAPRPVSNRCQGEHGAEQGRIRSQ
ncbi:hypothetical protein FPSE_10666 [Fusarium pseudograminearum CS3096]|uniref:Uncharacterized protein n=1 Tax=Fusarium pseudograminearum (strain CS3096) TaxID=1028729 RepID=K3V6V5_FUSPC|nr:hypothetical protein FPSE_10666 [Fusarium pseudograminearum CS3096]EKJ69142.1 hypothetical protein FPSE_10666 [Fusarium pseudograminearum CS3096]